MRSSLLLAVYTVTLICSHIGLVYGGDDFASGGGYYPNSFDFIVVGGGATGNVVATRLALAGKSVLVLEGGAPSQSVVGGTDFVAASYYFNGQGEAVFNRPLTRYDVPAFCYSAASDYPGSPTPSYPLDSNLGPYKTFSKIQGGNSVHNYMVWTRTTPRAQNSWNVTGWAYNDLLPYFKKVENVSGTTIAFNSAVHGFNGPIKINNAQVPDPIGRAYIQACVNAGYPRSADFSAPTNYAGCGDPVFNINDRGVRASSLGSYLAPNLWRSNLQVRTKALVTKILFSNTTVPKAVAVQYKDADDGDVHTVYAAKEIILSAGAVNTIKTLQLSGVGPAALLRGLGIPIVADLPVGKNMSTHPLIFTYYRYNISGANPYANSAHGVQYAINGTGVFASIGVPAMAHLRSNPSLPDIDLHVQVALTNANPGLASVLALRLTFQRDLEITVRSRDPDVAPFLRFNPFTRNEDVQGFVDFIKLTRRIVSTPPASSFFGEEVTPGPQYQTDAQLAAYIRGGAGLPILTHLHGGAPLGNAGDAKAVLDNRARVRKVQGLRVADSSMAAGEIVALPTQNLLGYGEKVADLILADNPY